MVEKILLRGETLPPDWDCDGTSGYDFMNDVNALQHDARGEAPLGALWQSVSGRSADFAAEEQAARREIIARSFSAQLEACAGAFHRACAREGTRVDPRLAAPRADRAAGAFPGLSHLCDRERAARRATAVSSTAGRRGRAGDMPVRPTACVDRSLALARRARGDPASAHSRDRAATQFQQLSAPVAAKAVEDTAFYRYGRLLSRNDVGFDAERFGDRIGGFHARVLRRQADFPHAMLATATHDHKRGEDVRARLAVLSEHARGMGERPAALDRSNATALRRWRVLLPHAGDIAILLQTIVGAWPLDLDIEDEARAAARSPSASRTGRRRRCARPSSRPTGRCRTKPMNRRRASC